MDNTKERIVIIGGGFAGLNLAKHLDKKKFDITLVDRNNYHSFPPLFYQVASGGLDPGSISFPFRREFRKKSMRGVRFHMGDVRQIDISGKKLLTGEHIIHYDKLVIAAGTTNNFFGNNGLLHSVYTMKSTPEAIRLRNEILDRLERASATKEPDTRTRLLTFVVIGGGPSGVEVAGALGEMKRYIVPREYPEIRPEEVKIILLEGSDRVLRTMSEGASRAALKYLGSLLVDVRLGTLMKEYDGETVALDNGERIICDTVVWTAGVTATPFTTAGGELPLGPGGRIVTDEFNRVNDVRDIYAIGDISYRPTPEYPRGVPQLAQPAIQQARTLALNLNAGEFTVPFRYKDKGSMATIGRNRAVADLKHIHLYGFFAWVAWMSVHLLSLLGMRNKATVMVNWTWAYFTYGTSLRMLFYPTRYPRRKRWS